MEEALNLLSDILLDDDDIQLTHASMGKDETVCNTNKYIYKSNYIPTVHNIFACQKITQTLNNTHNSFIMTW